MLKKVLTITLLMSMMSMTLTPVLAVESSKSTQPKQFKSMVKKNKKVSDDYKYAYINMDFWNNFNDENLNAYIDKAVKNNYDLKNATLAVEEYYQNTRIQFANELPQVGAGFSPNYVKMPGSSDWDWMFATPAIANYEVDIFLKNRDKTKSAKKLYEGSKYDERAAYIAIASSVGTAYLNVVRLDKLIDIQQEIVDLRQEIYDLMLARNREGITSTADTVKANKALVQGQTDLIELQKQREFILHQLAVLVGESPENVNEFKRTAYENINYTGNIPSEISSDVIVQRPDFLKAEAMVEKAGIDVRVARKEFLPSINLTGIALFNASQIGSAWSTSSMLGALAAGAMLPIFTGGRRIANLKLKKVQYDKVLNKYMKTNLTAIQEVNDALVSVKKDTEKMAQTKKQAELESADFMYNRDKFNEGIISKLDLIQYKENLLSIDKMVAQQQIECMVDYIGLYKAVGSKL
uniref:efflux transporter outer membrane subunit n=1 Tax=Candidatus Scatousia sp. TaxID=3085663 RepID=UPI0040284F49